MALVRTLRSIRFLGAAVAALSVALAAQVAFGVTDPLPGAATKPDGFTISPPWAPGVSHTVTQAYGTGLHLGTDTTCCNNDQYALDIDMRLDEPVYPIAPGKVVYAAPAAGSWATFGNLVFIDHQNGFQSAYAHLNSLRVATGQSVDTNTVLGGAGGSGGWATHLHFAVYQGAQFYNTSLGAGQYGGHSMVPEPFANCGKNGSPCENLNRGDLLTRTSSAAAPAPAQPAASPIRLIAGAVDLSWAVSLGSVAYEIQVVPLNNDGPGVDLVVSDPVQVATGSFSLSPAVLGQGNYVLLPGARYSWRVRQASLLGAWGRWSELQWFSRPAPSASTLRVLPPAGGNDRTPTVRWLDSDSSDFYYEVQVSADPQFRTGADAVAPVYWNLVHGGLTDPLNSWTVPDGYDLTPGSYYARVRQRVQATPAAAAEPGIAWSSAASFQVF